MLATPAVLWAGWPLLVRGARAFLSLNLNMFALIALGVGAAFLYSVVAVLWPSVIPEAFKHHGNAEGTETQLGDAGEFLRLAFESMSPTQQTEFLDSQAVAEFMEREGGKEDHSEQSV